MTLFLVVVLVGVLVVAGAVVRLCQIAELKEVMPRAPG